MKNKISIIGAGAWGTALAQVFAEAGHTVTLYARSESLAAALRDEGQNETYLPGVALSRNIRVTSHLAEAIKDAGIVLLVTPTQHVRHLLGALKSHLAPGAVLVNCAKGIEISSGKLLGEIAAEIAPDMAYAVLSGPTFAHEVARGLPAAVTFATTAPAAKSQAWAQALSAKTFRPYLPHDPIGAEIAGALKNVVAIACGIVEGKKLGENAKAAVMTRGMAEIKRFGVKKGANAETFLGLAGIGDLTLTCHSLASRNFSLGVGLGQGRKLADIMAERKSVSEGVTTARAIAEHAQKLGVDMPIAAAVYNILYHHADIDTVVGALLSRDLKEEGR